jgi:uncharacterized protein YkvS
MVRATRFLSIAAISIAMYLFPGLSCLPEKAIPVQGFLFGRPIETTVDYDLAKLMLTNPQHSKVLRLFDAYESKPLNTNTLAEISAKYSPDVATFYFLQSIYKTDVNRQAQDLYTNYVENLDSNNTYNGLVKLKEYYIVFIPGLAYREDTSTGADFAQQRKLLADLGVKNELIETDEWGLSEYNAEVIAKQLKELSAVHNKIIVVSASKGGLETAIALGKILNPEETKSIAAWVSVGGILRGSPIADDYLSAPKCWLAEFSLWIKGRNLDIVKDMSYKRRSDYFKDLSFPANLKIIHFVAVPLATQIADEVKDRYCSMIRFGPNDGLTPIADELTENGIVISEIGLDHFFRDKDIDEKTLALALIAMDIQK